MSITQQSQPTVASTQMIVDMHVMKLETRPKLTKVSALEVTQGRHRCENEQTRTSKQLL